MKIEEERALGGIEIEVQFVERSTEERNATGGVRSGCGVCLDQLRRLGRRVDSKGWWWNLQGMFQG